MATLQSPWLGSPDQLETAQVPQQWASWDRYSAHLEQRRKGASSAHLEPKGGLHKSRKTIQMATSQGLYHHQPASQHTPRWLYNTSSFYFWIRGKKENLELASLGCQRGRLAVQESDGTLGVLSNLFSIPAWASSRHLLCIAILNPQLERQKDTFTLRIPNTALTWVLFPTDWNPGIQVPWAQSPTQ